MTDAMAELLSTDFSAVEEEKTKTKKSKRLIAAFDAETDPFKRGRIPKPFSWGIKIENGEYYKFWSDDCTAQFIKFLKGYSHPLKLFAHNGGKFDFIFLLEKGVFDGEPMLINSRIVEAPILGGRHILRDSYAMMPVPLAAYKKDEIDYNLMECENREEHKEEILKYLQGDCEYLLDLVLKFIARFGDNITVGSAAMSQLKQLHPFEKIPAEIDEQVRHYYKGGRVQCFETGKVEGDLVVYDVNSMYPTVMSEKNHPTHEGAIFLNSCSLDMLDEKGQLTDFPECGFFATVQGRFVSEFNHFPVRTKQGLSFEQKEGLFEVTHHELQTALKHGVFILDDLESVVICPNSTNFAEYVDKFMIDKVRAKEIGDKAGELFAKLMLNSAYGKFGQNPSKFKDYLILEPWEVLEVESRNQELLTALDGEAPDGYFWEESETTEIYTIYERKPDDVSGAYNDVFVASSVTGAARALLMDALITCKRPVYCDTDSIICEALGDNCDLHPSRLGAWDLEGTGDTLYCYGKKVYALYKDGKPFTDNKGKEKTANKGVKMTATQIRSLVDGKSFRWKNDAPSLKLNGKHVFIERELKAKDFTKKL